MSETNKVEEESREQYYEDLGSEIADKFRRRNLAAYVAYLTESEAYKISRIVQSPEMALEVALVALDGQGFDDLMAALAVRLYNYIRGESS